MSFDGTINVYFVTTISANASKKDRETAAAEFATALSLIRNHVIEDNIRHIQPSEGIPLIASGRLTKKDVFVFDRFEGDFFQQLQQTKSLIIGPRCLITCLLKCEPIPLGNSPVYTTAMRDLRISGTGITPQEKERLRVIIHWMGGHYFLNFGRSVTHLISNTIKSTKYEHATLNGIPVMHVDWVQRVWDRSIVENVSATDEEFDKYRLPIFFGTNITCTGLETEKKNEVMRLVNENGGTYHRAFRSNLIDIVITERSKTNSEKYIAAVRCKKDILVPEWIFESVQKGYALPTKIYQVKSLKVSTPTKTDQTIADFTQTDISRISVPCTKRGSSMMHTINESGASSSAMDASHHPTPVTPGKSKDLQREVQKKYGADAQYRTVYNEICQKETKKAGIFLDGCCIYLSGFRNAEREKLNRILNVGGATRYDVVNDKITHIIVGQIDDAEFKTWKKEGLLSDVNIVRLDWLLESINRKQPASENIYRVSLTTSREPDAPSPSSKRALRSMNSSFKQPELPSKKKLFDNKLYELTQNMEEVPLPGPLATSTEMPLEEEEQNLIAQYSQENGAAIAAPLPPKQKSPHQPCGNVTAPLASSTQHTDRNPPATPIAAAPMPSTSELTTATFDYVNLDFFQGASVYIDKESFEEDVYTQLIHECEGAQGNVVESTFRDPVDFALVCFQRTLDETTLPVKAREIITDLYVEDCMTQNKLVTVEYFHKHIPHTANSMPLVGMTIVISIYTRREQDFIDSIAQLLGAKTNTTYVKKERPLLVCPKPEGSKYQASLKWGFPTVTSMWLVQCAASGNKLPFQGFLVGNSPLDFSISPTSSEHNKIAKTNVQAAKDETQMQSDRTETNLQPEHNTSTGAPNQIDTESELTPLRNKRVSELAGPVRSTRNSLPNSPHTPVNNLSQPTCYNFDIMEDVLANLDCEDDRQLLREVILEMRKNQTPEIERIRRQACTPINRRLPTPKGIPDFCTTPEFEKRMAEAFERRWRLPTKKIKPDTPLDEIRRRVLLATHRAMGLSVENESEYLHPKSEDNDFVFERPSSSSKSASATPMQHKASRSSGLAPRAIFVHNSPDASRNASASETFIPNTQSPNGSGRRDSVNNSAAGQRISIMGKSSINFDKISFEETAADGPSTSRMGRVSTAAECAKSSPEVKQITEFLQKCETRRQSLKRSVSRHHANQGNENDLIDTEAHYVQPFESEQFGVGTEEMVGWRDPAEFSIERRLKAAPSMQHVGTPRFIISCSNDDVREDIVGKIKQLGGQVCDDPQVNYDPSCTHLVCERPNRGEKILGCISSGKWVLSLKYIEECFAKDVFINEELYEWGNCKALNLPQLTADEQLIALAAHRWRVELGAASDRGAFSDFRVILRTPPRNLDALKNVIKAGKGLIIEAKSPYCKNNGAHQATHCFVDIKKVPLTPDDKSFLVEHGVRILSQMYINAYLMSGNESEYDKYEIKL